MKLNNLSIGCQNLGRRGVTRPTTRGRYILGVLYNEIEVNDMTDIDNAMVADVVSLLNVYHKALGLDASSAERSAAVQAHLLMEQNRHLAEISDKLSAIVGTA